jgi:hypothetical protein
MSVLCAFILFVACVILCVKSKKKKVKLSL